MQDLEPGASESKEVVGESVINLLLVDLGSPRNIGLIIRTSWVLGGGNIHLYIYDPRNRLETNREDVDLTSINLVGSGGAYTKVNDLEKFLSEYPGRIIATDISEQATSLVNFSFQRSDLLMFGNENRGYRDESLKEHQGIGYLTERLVVPMCGKKYELPDRGNVVPEDHGVYPNLNVATTVAIVAYAALEQLGYFEEFSLRDIK